MSERQDPNESGRGQVSLAVSIYRNKVAKADGKLVRLRKTTADGKVLYIATRHLENPRRRHLGIGRDANPNFYKWDNRNPATGVVLVDVYIEDKAVRQPLAHMDWWLQKDYANGGGNMHDAAIPRNDHEQLARERWYPNDYTAFKVDYDYHRQGIGSLMVATSAVVLPALGVRNFYTGGLLLSAKRTYERFGIREEDFPDVPAFNRHLPIERLTECFQVNKTITEFV